MTKLEDSSCIFRYISLRQFFETSTVTTCLRCCTSYAPDDYGNSQILNFLRLLFLLPVVTAQRNSFARRFYSVRGSKAKTLEVCLLCDRFITAGPLPHPVTWFELAQISQRYAANSGMSPYRSYACRSRIRHNHVA